MFHHTTETNSWTLSRLSKTMDAAEQSPLEPLFRDYEDALDITSETPLHIKVQKVDKEADVRAVWFQLLEKIPESELDFVLFSRKLSTGETIKNTAIKFNLLPEVSGSKLKHYSCLFN